jgi:hypothetical protein
MLKFSLMMQVNVIVFENGVFGVITMKVGSNKNDWYAYN